MFNNGFGGYNSNTFNSAAKNLQSGNIAGLNKNPTNVAGINNGPSNVAGISNMPNKHDPFTKVVRDNSGPAKQIMNSQGQNMIHNDFRGISNKY